MRAGMLFDVWSTTSPWEHCDPDVEKVAGMSEEDAMEALPEVGL